MDDMHPANLLRIPATYQAPSRAFLSTFSHRNAGWVISFDKTGFILSFVCIC
jgi:hypothetical protein